MPRPAQEWFLILDDKLRTVGSRAYPDVTSAIFAADAQAPWPMFQGRLVVRSNYDERGVKVGDGQGDSQPLARRGAGVAPVSQQGADTSSNRLWRTPTNADTTCPK